MYWVDLSIALFSFTRSESITHPSRQEQNRLVIVSSRASHDVGQGKSISYITNQTAYFQANDFEISRAALDHIKSLIRRTKKRDLPF